VHDHEEPHRSEAADHAHEYADHDADTPGDWLAPPPDGPDDRQITSLLFVFESPVAAALLSRSVGALPNVQAASPAFEIARLGRLLGGAFALARAFGYGLAAAALLTLFVTLYSALRDRRYDLALLRAVGVGRGRLLAHVLLEGLLVAAAGALAGVAAGHVAASAVGWRLAAEQGIAVTGAMWHPLEAWIVAAALCAGVVAAALPAWQAYRTEVALVLGEGA
jgi:putative ABC transport system permease protein